MPELPEVETVKRGLEKLIVSKTITGTHVFESPKSFPNSKADVTTFLVGATVKTIRRRAKVLLIDLSTEWSLMVHLKMTGQLVFVGKERFGAGHPSDSLVGKLPDRSTRVDIMFSDNSHLYFNDQRKFGWMKLLPTTAVEEVDFMAKLGPEPLETTLTPALFVERLRKRNGTSIKAALLDQTVVAGIGNIYADESLWGAKLYPARRVSTIPDADLHKLLSEIRVVMHLAIEKGGSTDKNYVNAEGKKGSYIDFARVFRRENQACPRHPDVMIEKIRVAGRGTHICPVCQAKVE